MYKSCGAPGRKVPVESGSASSTAAVPDAGGSGMRADADQGLCRRRGGFEVEVGQRVAGGSAWQPSRCGSVLCFFCFVWKAVPENQ